MKKNAQVIAVDLGASGGKVFAGSFRDGSFSLKETHRFSHEAVTFHVPDRGGNVEERSCWDEALLYANILTGLRGYVRDFGPQADSLGIDTWGADGAFVTADGVTLGPTYAYRDHRLDRMVEAVKARIDAARLYGITGIHFQPFNVSNQMHWFVRNRGDLVRKGVRYLPVPTLFSWYLGGGIQVDSSWASVTQLMDSKKRKWSREVLKALDIPAWLMPEIVDPGTVVGDLRPGIARSVGLTGAKIVAVASHDTASAFAAAPVGNPAHALIISSGTWSLVGKLLRKPITTAEAMAANLSNEGGIGNVRFLKNCMGTWLVQELRRVWRIRDGREMGWDEMNRLTEQGASMQSFLDPDDPGFYNPADMEAQIHEYCRRTGQTPPADRGSTLRMVYESLALKYRAVSEKISAVSGKPNKVVHIVGGGSRNELLNRFTADACGMRVVAGPEEATAVGNAMVQALALGALERMADAQELIRGAFPIREYRPKDTQTWDRAYERFRELLKE